MKMYQKIKRNFEASYCRKSSTQDSQNHKKLIGSFIMIMTCPRPRSVRRACTAQTTEDADTKEASSEAAQRAVAASEVARCSCPAQTSHEWRQFQSDKRLAQADTSPSPTYFLRSLTGATLYWLTEWSGIRFRMRHRSGLIGRCVELGVHWKDHMERRRRAYETKPLSEARTKAKQFNSFSVGCANSPMTWIKSLDGFLRSYNLQPRCLELINWIIDCPPQANTVLMRCVHFWWFYILVISKLFFETKFDEIPEPDPK